MFNSIGTWFFLLIACFHIINSLRDVSITGSYDPTPQQLVGTSLPYRGYSTWSLQATTYPGYGHIFMNESSIRVQAQALQRQLARFGFIYVNLDSGWSSDTSDGYGRMVYDPVKFPSGLPSFANYVHSLGLKLGVYIIPGAPWDAYYKPILGTKYHIYDICTAGQPNAFPNSRRKIDFSKPGAQEFINSQVDLFASWGVDFIKLDGVVPGSNSANFPAIDSRPDVAAYHKAIAQSGREIWLTLSWRLDPTYLDFWRTNANAYRIEQDVESYDSHLTNYNDIRRNADSLRKWVSQYGFIHNVGSMDMDSLLIGNGVMDNMSNNERRTTMTLWVLAASPLYIGDDLTKLDSWGLNLLTNTEVLAIQARNTPAHLIGDDWPHHDGWSAHQVWAAKNMDGTITVGLVNIGGDSGDDNRRYTITAYWRDLGITGNYNVRDLWNRVDMGKFDAQFAQSIDTHDSGLYLLTPV